MTSGGHYAVVFGDPDDGEEREWVTVRMKDDGPGLPMTSTHWVDADGRWHATFEDADGRTWEVLGDGKYRRVDGAAEVLDR